MATRAGTRRDRRIHKVELRILGTSPLPDLRLQDVSCRRSYRHNGRSQYRTVKALQPCYGRQPDLC